MQAPVTQPGSGDVQTELAGRAAASIESCRMCSCNCRCTPQSEPRSSCVPEQRAVGVAGATLQRLRCALRLPQPGLKISGLSSQLRLSIRPVCTGG